MNYVLTSTTYTVQCVQYHNNYSQELGHLCRHPDLAPGGHGGPLVQLAPAHTHTHIEVGHALCSKMCTKTPLQKVVYSRISFALVRCYSYVESRQNVRVNFRASKHFFCLTILYLYVSQSRTGRYCKA